MFSDSMMLGGGRKAAFSIANSVRLDGVADYFTRTPNVVGNRKTWTFSAWVKRCAIGTQQFLMITGINSNESESVFFDANDTLNLWVCVSNAWVGRVQTNAVFRDTTSWGHLVISKDVTTATPKIYWNGTEQPTTVLTEFANMEGYVNNTYEHRIGEGNAAIANGTFNGYITQPILVDGAALDPSSFGETDPVTGSWRPKRYMGEVVTYGSDLTQPGMSVTGTFHHALNCGPITALIDNTTQPAADNAGHTATSHFVIDLGDGNAQPVRQALLTNHTSTGINVAGITWGCWFSDDNTTFTLAASKLMETGLGTVNRFDIPDVGAHRYWKFGYLSGVVSGDCWLQEVSLHTATATGYGTNGFHLDFADAGGSGGTVNTAFAGGFGACQVVINPARPLPNKAWITQIGVTQNSAESGKSVYIVRDDGGNGYTVMWVSAPFNHAGSGLQQVAVNYLVPETGTYFMAVDCPGGGLAWGHDSDLIGTPYRYSLTTRSLGESFVAEIAADVTMSEAPPALTWTDGRLGWSATGVNHWFPVSLGAADVVGDTPTNNYPTINPLSIFSTDSGLSNGNLSFTGATNVNLSDCGATVDFNADGSWYWEVFINKSDAEALGNGSAIRLGVQTLDRSNAWSYAEVYAGSGLYNYRGYKYALATNEWSPYASTFTTNDTISVLWDGATKELSFWKNGVDQGVAFSGFTQDRLLPNFTVNNYPNDKITVNFGQRPFVHTPPAGFKSLCTANLPKPVIQAPAKHMDVVTYTGNGTARAISGLDFQPDLVWVKSRSNGNSGHTLFDVIRGPGKILSSAWSGAELTEYPDTLISFNPDGFGLGGDVTAGTINVTGQTYVAWCWKAGGAAVANTDGTIASQVSANPTAGFSVVAYTGDGAGAASFGHGLGAVPKMVIIKSRGEVRDWPVYHAGLTSAANILYLNSTLDQFALRSFNDTTPTSTVVNVHWNSGVNHTNKSGDTFVAYCWAEVPGFSKFGSYTSNGSSDGAFVHCGFRPRLVLAKRTDATGSWRIVDTARDPYNEVVKSLYPNSIGAEDPSDGFADFTATGFKIRRAVYTGTYIYAAFAEAPLGGAKTVPAKAR